MNNEQTSENIFMFDEIMITFTDQDGKPLQIEDKADLTLLINKQKFKDILQNQEQENMLLDMEIHYL